MSRVGLVLGEGAPSCRSVARKVNTGCTCAWMMQSVFWQHERPLHFKMNNMEQSSRTERHETQQVACRGVCTENEDMSQRFEILHRAHRKWWDLPIGSTFVLLSQRSRR